MNKLFNRIRKISFTILAVLILILGIATFIEQAKGTDYVYQHFYGTVWFIILWAIAACGIGITIFTKKLYKNIPVLLLHLSFVLILIGAFFTRISSINGYLHLREDIETSYYEADSGEVHELPFGVKLLSFDVLVYPGTQSPSDYMSTVQIIDKESQNGEEYLISMNNILKYKGYRFYQSSFDEDKKGSILTVSKDIYGIPVTYTGYFLLFASMIWILLYPKGRFRTLLRSPLLKRGVAVVAFFFAGAFSLQASEENPLLSKDEATPNKEQSKKLGEVQILYNGRITSIQTLAIDFTRKLVSDNSYKYANAEQVFAGWLFFPQKWQWVKMFEIDNPELKKILGITGKHACFADMFDSELNYKLAPYYKEIYHGGKQNSFQKAALKLDEKIQLINMLQQGELLTIFPYKQDNKIQWYTPTSSLPKELSYEEVLFTRNFFAMYYTALLENNTAEIDLLLNKLKQLQNEYAGKVVPSATHQKIERLNNDIPLFSTLFKVNLSLGFLAFIFYVLQLLRNKRIRRFSQLTTITLLVVFMIYSLGFIARWYIGGHLPLSNGYETMLFVGWCSMLIALLFGKSSDIIPIFGLLISGFTLLVAHLVSMNPQITPLVPVLSSPLLTVHVSLIMFSYALVGFIVLNSITYLLTFFIKRQNENIILSQNKLYLLNQILLYPTAFFLGAGIFVGAIWANVSWGRYWGWDPKEVWALITFLIAMFPLHGKSIKIFSNPFFFNCYAFLILASVLMTYFGVNFFLGGLHSYAGSASMGNILYFIIGIAILLIVFMFFAHRRYKQSKQLL